ncbi:MAG: PAS domain S-box protein [Acidobacteriota bacterium]
MSIPLKVLILEDRVSDADLALRELSRAGFTLDWLRVETEPDYLAHLAPSLDLILADYSLPQFDALRALELLRESRLDIPFIIVSANIGEDIAVSAMKQGADDYLLKDRMARLGQAVMTALERKRQRSEKQQAEAALRESEDLFRATFEQAAVGMALVGLDGRFLQTNQKLCDFTGFSQTELLVRTSADITHPSDWQAECEYQGKLLAGEIQSYSLEKRYLCRDGSYAWANLTHSLVRDISGEPKYFVGVLEDIGERKRTEQALRDSEERYRLLFDKSPHPMWVYDLEKLTFLAVNDAAVGHYGYSREEFLGMLLKGICPQDEASRLINNQTYPHTNYDRVGFWVHQKKDGSLIDVEISSHGLDFGGRPARLVLAHDVTERRLAEEQLRKSEARYRELVETAPDAIYTISTADGAITSMNRACEKIIGYKPEEMIGRNYTDFIHSEDVPTVIDVFRGILEGGQAFSYELRILTKHGEYVVVELITIPQIQNGKLVGMLGIARDITERKRDEEERLELHAAIAKSAQEWQMTFDAIESPVLILDGAGRITKLNHAAKQLAGGEKTDVVRRSIKSLGSRPLWQTAVELVDLIRETRTPDACQARDQATGRTWDLAASLANSSEDNDERVILVIREITRTVELQASLHRSETMSLLGSLVSGVAHEVRNPLFGISATLDAFEARFGAIPDYQQYINVLHTEVNRLNDLMKDLLEYGRPHSRLLQSGSIEDVITQATSSCTLLAKRAEVQVVAHVGNDLPLIRMDAKRLLQVFLNLLENAIQHIQPGGVITMEAKETRQDDRRWVVCSVKDTGPGFQQNDLPKLFEPFFTRRRGGTGLGLSIVQKIVEEHGGKITAGNLPEGGALVSLRFPAIVTDSLSLREVA